MSRGKYCTECGVYIGHAEYYFNGWEVCRTCWERLEQEQRDEQNLFLIGKVK